MAAPHHPTGDADVAAGTGADDGVRVGSSRQIPSSSAPAPASASASNKRQVGGVLSQSTCSEQRHGQQVEHEAAAAAAAAAAGSSIQGSSSSPAKLTPPKDESLNTFRKAASFAASGILIAPFTSADSSKGEEAGPSSSSPSSPRAASPSSRRPTSASSRSKKEKDSVSLSLTDRIFGQRNRNRSSRPRSPGETNCRGTPKGRSMMGSDTVVQAGPSFRAEEGQGEANAPQSSSGHDEDDRIVLADTKDAAQQRADGRDEKTGQSEKEEPGSSSPILPPSSPPGTLLDESIAPLPRAAVRAGKEKEVDDEKSSQGAIAAKDIAAQDASPKPTASSPDTEPLTPASLANLKLDPSEDPHNWSYSYKWATVSIVSLMGFISPMGASIIVPGARLLDFQFHLRSRTLSIVPVSTYVLGLAVGPFVFAPASELIGRRPVYVSTSLLFVLFNIATALAPSYAALNILRFIAGAVGSTGPTLGSGTIGDMFSPSERGRAVSLYGLGPLLGPVIGNIIGGFIAEGSGSWRWLLWTLTIFSAAIAIVIIFCLQETYEAVLIDRKRKALIKKARVNTQGSRRPQRNIAQRMQKQAKRCLHPSEHAKQKFKLAMTRPFRLLFTNPICAIFSFYLGFVYGEIFIFLTQHPLLFQRRDLGPGPPERGPHGIDRLPTYNWTWGQSGLSYLGLGIGFLCAMMLNALYNDTLYHRLVASEGRVGWFILTKNKAQIRESMQERQQAKLARQQEQRQEGSQKNAGGKDDAVDIEKVASSSQESKSLSQQPSASSGVVATLTPAPPVQPPRKGRPEYRLPFCLLGMLTLPIGLLIFGWSADQRTYWIVPLLGSLITGMSAILCFQTILVYLVDAFVPYSASATACSVLVRSLLAATFPLFAETLFASLGFGWGSTLLAGIGVLGIPVPIILFRYGETLRNRFKFTG